MTKFNVNKKELFCIIIILVLAGFFRFAKLDSIPPGLYPDEAINANQAITDPGKLFYRENNGREGLFINLIALSFRIFGVSMWSLRIVPAVMGTLTILGIYLLSKELEDTIHASGSVRYPALFSALFLAASFWHINFSRIGFRAILVPLLMAFSFYFLFRGFTKKDTKSLLCAGVIFGLGFHTYISFRFAVLILVPIFVGLFLMYKRENKYKVFLFSTSYFLLSTFLVALPIGIYFLQNPSDFLERASSISIFGQGKPLLAAGESLLRHLGMFNLVGDPNWRHNISCSPALFWPVGILFLIGLLYSGKELFFSIKDKKHSSFLVYGFLITWWFIMLLPGVLTYEGIPHSLRCIGAIPPTFIFSGLGSNLLFQKIKERLSKKLERKDRFYYCLIILNLFILLITFVLAQYFRYFEIWGGNKETQGAFSQDYVYLGDYLNSLPDSTLKYVIVNQSGAIVDGLPIPAQTPIFIERTGFEKPRAIYLNPNELDKINLTEDQQGIVALMKYDSQIIVDLVKMFPQGRIDKQNEIWLYKIN